jgi:hypothetical protein
MKLEYKGHDVFYHQTDKKSAENILKNGFNTPEVWAAPDEEGNYGNSVITIYAPKPKKPFIKDIYQLLYDDKKISYEDAQKIVKKNTQFFEDLGGEINPEAFNKLRELGYDVIIEDNGDRCFLYPETLKYDKEILNLSESYKKRLQELANIKEGVSAEEHQNFVRFVDEIAKRVPFLKSYKKAEVNNDNVSKTIFQKSKCFGEKTITSKNKLIHFEDYCIFSELLLTYKHFNDHKWYFFRVENFLRPTFKKDANSDELFNKVFLAATNQINEQFSAAKEIMIPEDKEISEEEINSMVGKINETFFKFEEYLLEHFKFKFF